MTASNKEEGYIYSPYIPFYDNPLSLCGEGIRIPIAEEPRTGYSTWLPCEEHPRDKYHRLHSCCLSCGSKSYSSTLMGYTFDMTKPEEYRDENQINCSCGWTGIAHDLTP